MKAACIQMTSGREPSANLAIIAEKIAAAVAAGAELVALPETCLFMEKGRAAMQQRLRAEAATDGLAELMALAGQHQITLLVGSAIIANDAGAAVNRSLLLGRDGTIIARYDKIHLFDVRLPNGETHAESASYVAGDRAVTAELPHGARLGLTICYDLRFPALYRALALAGADIIAVPSAFTCVTGAAHWHILLRARAIETGCFILAPAQIGAHENGRETYGHSLIVNPWGEIIAEAAAGDDFCLAEIDIKEVAAARARIPSLAHGRDFT